MSKVIALLLMSLFLVSCGENKKLSSVKLKLIQGNTTSGVDTTGGVLLMGRSEDGLNSFRTSIGSTSESLSMDLAKGRWEFAAVTWANTNGPMTGDNRCAYTGFVDLKDTEVNVTFNLTQTRCLTDFNGNQFADSSYMTSAGKFLEFFPVMCNNNTAGADNCQYLYNPTNIVSYKIIYKAESKGLAAGSFTTLTSNCLGISNSVRARIPVTNEVNGSPLKFSLQYFKNSSCDGVPELAYDFNNGLVNNQVPVWNHVAAQSSYYSYFYLNPGAQYDQVAVNPSSFAFNSSGIMIAGVPAFPSINLTYIMPSSIPSNVSEVCFTLESTCPANKWIPLQLVTGNITLDAGLADGSHILKLYYKTVAQVVSSTYASTQFAIDMTPPLAPTTVSPVGSVTNGIEVTWNSTDDLSFSYWKVYVCTESSCSSNIGFKQIPNFSTKYVNFVSADLTEAIATGQSRWIMVKAYDVFGREGIATPVSLTVSN